MHVQFFPVYVLTRGAHDSEPLFSFDLIVDSHESQVSLPGVSPGYSDLFGYP